MYKDQSLYKVVNNFVLKKIDSGELSRDIGIAVSAVQNDQVFFQETFGLRDRKNKLSLTSKTQFPISSLTKAFSSLASIMLDESGIIDLHQPINTKKKLIKLKDYGTSEKISIADILTHRTGIPAHDFLWIYGVKNLDDLMSRLQHLEPVPEGFRKNFIYSNLMYSSLGILFRELALESLEDFISRKILVPLEMTRTTFSLEEAKHTSDFALPYMGEHQLRLQRTDIISPAGGLYSNLEDMSCWLRFNLKGKDEKGMRLVSEDSWKSLFQEHINVEQLHPLLLQGLHWLGDKLFYGYGWFLGTYSGKKVFFHMGYIDGYSKTIVFLPELQLGFFVMLNNNLSPLSGQLIELMLCHVLGNKTSSSVITQLALPEMMKSSLSVRASFYAGLYKNSAYGTIELFQTSKGPVIRYVDKEWSLNFLNENQAVFGIEIFGLTLPMTLNLETLDGKTKKIYIPFSMDPRVSPQVFNRMD